MPVAGSFIPAYTAANVLTGPAMCFTQVYDAATPPVVPPSTKVLGAAWDTPWKAIGATEAGVTFAFKRSVDKITIDEQITPVDERTKDLAFTLDVDLSEDTVDSMLLAYGGGIITTTPAATGTPGTKQLVIGTDLTYFAFGFEGVNPYGQPRIVVVPICVSIGNAKTQYQRGKKQRSYATSFESLVPPEQCTIIDVTEPAL